MYASRNEKWNAQRKQDQGILLRPDPSSNEDDAKEMHESQNGDPQVTLEQWATRDENSPPANVGPLLSRRWIQCT